MLCWGIGFDKGVVEVRIAVATFSVGVMALAVFGQQAGPPEPFEVPDLELVSYAALPEGSEAYTGPVCAAIVLAWFAHHGFPALLPDLNEDGIVDEQDTVELAIQLSRAMDVRPERGAWDPWLVDALARYVGERVPDAFVLKIYDESFPAEYQEGLGRSFDGDIYPGIAIELRPNPSRDAYAEELLAGEGVILGVGE
ncbi:MAG TPA: hypothetical protein ENI38_00960, partial [Candidatus Acetothermia bacterium]|nr:hypothetical protein [Candidatus Acetothermia bacterium]